MSITLHFDDVVRVVPRWTAEAIVHDQPDDDDDDNNNNDSDDNDNDSDDNDKDNHEDSNAKPTPPSLAPHVTVHGLCHPDLVLDFLRDRHLPYFMTQAEGETLRRSLNAIPNTALAQSLAIELDHVYACQREVRIKHGTDELYVKMLLLGDAIWLHQFDAGRAQQTWMQAYSEAMRGMKRRHFFPNSNRAFEAVDWRPSPELDGEKALSAAGREEASGAALKLMHLTCLHVLYAALAIGGPARNDKFVTQACRYMSQAMAYDGDISRAFIALMDIKLDVAPVPSSTRANEEFAVQFHRRVQNHSVDSQTIARAAQPYAQDDPPAARVPKTGLWLDMSTLPSLPLISVSVRGIPFAIPSGALDRLGEDGRRIRILLQVDGTWRDSGYATSATDTPPLLDCDPNVFALVHQFILTGQVPADGVRPSMLGRLEQMADYLCMDLLHHEVTFFHPLRKVMAGLRPSKASYCLFDRAHRLTSTSTTYVFEQLCLGNALFARLGDRRGARQAWLDAWNTADSNGIDFSLMDLVWRHGIDNSLFDRGLTLTECTLAQCQLATIELLLRGSSTSMGQLTHKAMQLDASNATVQQLRFLYLATTRPSVSDAREQVSCRVTISPDNSTLEHCSQRCMGREMLDDDEAKNTGCRCTFTVTQAHGRIDDVVSLITLAWYSWHSHWQKHVGLAAAALIMLVRITPWATEAQNMLSDLISSVKTNVLVHSHKVDEDNGAWRLDIPDDVAPSAVDFPDSSTVTRSDCVDALLAALLTHPSSTAAAHCIVKELERNQDWQRSEQLLMRLRSVNDSRDPTIAVASMPFDVDRQMATMLLQKFTALRARRDNNQTTEITLGMIRLPETMRAVMKRAIRHGARALQSCYAARPQRSVLERARCLFILARCYDEEGDHESAYYYAGQIGDKFQLQHFDATTDDDELDELQVMLKRICEIACRAKYARIAVDWLNATLTLGTAYVRRDPMAVRLMLVRCLWHAGEVSVAKERLVPLLDEDMHRLVNTPHLQEAHALDVDVSLAMDDEASVHHASHVFHSLLDDKHRTPERLALLSARWADLVLNHVQGDDDGDGNSDATE